MRSAAADSLKLSVVARRARAGAAFRALIDGATGAGAAGVALGSGLTVIVPFMNECTLHAYVTVPALSKTAENASPIAWFGVRPGSESNCPPSAVSMYSYPRAVYTSVREQRARTSRITGTKEEHMPQGDYQPDPDDWGPRVDVSQARDMQVGVCRSYRTGTGGKGPVWSGRVMIYATGDAVLEMEVSLLASTKTQGQRFVGMPQRSYQSNGETKYQRLVYMHGDGWPAAMQEAIERYMAGERGRVTRPWPRPSTGEAECMGGPLPDVQRRTGQPCLRARPRKDGTIFRMQVHEDRLGPRKPRVITITITIA